jgi:ubiquinone/menaquinone biosynthesis C-methylase UbiE
VLEIACGTGYWTEAAAAAAKTIVATDINPGPLEIARSKGLGPHVVFAQADAYALPDYGCAFDVGMAHFWWSHVSIVDQQMFLAHFASRLQPSAKLLMIDNTFVAGSTTAPSRTDAFGNSYQRRRLQDGSEYEIVKNFPTHAQLRSALGQYCGAMNILQLQYYWAASAELG